MSGPIPRFVWVTGMPRSGSTWVYNVVRSLLLLKRIQVKPGRMLRDELECIATANGENARPRRPGDPVWIFKLHAQLDGGLPDSRLVCTYRDPRDALVSYRRFMRSDFASALEAAYRMTQTIDHYRCLAAPAKLDLEYREIVSAPAAVAERLARHLGLDCSPEECRIAAAAYSKPSVRALIAASEAEGIGNGKGNGTGPHSVNADGSRRIFDPVTGFQSGHVSDYRDGDWASLLSLAEQRQLAARLGSWLAANGYSAGSS